MAGLSVTPRGDGLAGRRGGRRAGREAAFEESLVLRVLEAALDQDGYSTTVRAVAAATARR